MVAKDVTQEWSVRMRMAAAAAGAHTTQDWSKAAAVPSQDACRAFAVGCGGGGGMRERASAQQSNLRVRKVMMMMMMIYLKPSI